jgi:hypothetical protein
MQYQKCMDKYVFDLYNYGLKCLNTDLIQCTIGAVDLTQSKQMIRRGNEAVHQSALSYRFFAF